jgi:hypothetical protein
MAAFSHLKFKHPIDPLSRTSSKEEVRIWRAVDYTTFIIVRIEEMASKTLGSYVFERWETFTPRRFAINAIRVRRRE